MQWHLLAAAATEMKSLTPLLLIIHHHSQARVWKEECCVHAEWFKLWSWLHCAWGRQLRMPCCFTCCRGLILLPFSHWSCIHTCDARRVGTLNSLPREHYPRMR